ncbi:hypothetical protein [Sulfurisoma sediminicola]|uniref:Uncharacterized protein n=1 Tax=Sulfurisoma sediminicola TaxID=1381557 RepID=A0A497XKC6_9PROT|nr:hypothetical protein [Sulfurisoma sediminicola]RLJ68422.1 hypothetical protein DFR35_0983 [Sulfurisoma sediminicola]
MGRLLASLALAVAASPVFALDGQAPLQPQQAGYAFEQSRVVALQRFLGRAHGISLLVSACMDRPEYLDAALAAYIPWRERQESAIAAAQKELARHYFGSRAGEARWPDLVRALNLKNQLEPAPGAADLAAACETLPLALQRPRYDFAAQLRLQASLAEATAGAETELRWRWCREHLDDASRLVLDRRYDVWREINAPRQKQAEAALQGEWPFDAPADSLAAWQDLLQRDPLLRGDAAACEAFSESLKRPQAALRKAFLPTELSP